MPGLRSLVNKPQIPGDGSIDIIDCSNIDQCLARATSLKDVHVYYIILYYIVKFCCIIFYYLILYYFFLKKKKKNKIKKIIIIKRIYKKKMIFLSLFPLPSSFKSHFHVRNVHALRHNYFMLNTQMVEARV